MYIGLHVKYLLFLSDLNETRISSTGLRKIHKCTNFVKMLPVEAELFYVDSQTDMTNLSVAFRNFANAPKKNDIDRLCTVVFVSGLLPNTVCTHTSLARLYPHFGCEAITG